MKRILNFLVIWLNWRTLLAASWRAGVAIADWRTHLRKRMGKPIIDVVFITNMRDGVDRKKYLGLWHPASGHFNGPRYWLGNVSGRTRALDIVPEELMSIPGRDRARGYFLNAVVWSQKRGAKVILLAAGLKRILGRNTGQILRERFPGITFTIGDNGTAFNLIQEIFRALEKANLKSESSRIGVLGPSGFLGRVAVNFLRARGYEVIGLGTDSARLVQTEEDFRIETCMSFSEMGKVDAVIACTHHEDSRLSLEAIAFIRKTGKKLLVIDVAEPYNLTEEVFRACQGRVIRLDAGNAYSPRLEYVLGAISYRMFRLTKGVVFGCFAEAMAIASALNTRSEVKKIDWFTVSQVNMGIITGIFKEVRFSVPSPRCFGEPVESFDLTFASEQVQEASPRRDIRSVQSEVPVHA
ncbi:MAG: hypothetical protein PHZ04_03250 [Patescibacteria group bacterium]|nr:hypothetical protein [Patescibacteria group bacterium]MDD5294738.1 hypothetical protein [Patescibacteria group bacterium]MDD5554568.1 hypothetical protein [Patescibacteria group bacterium]